MRVGVEGGSRWWLPVLAVGFVVGLGGQGCDLPGEGHGPGFDDVVCPDDACRAEVAGAVKNSQSGEPIRSAEILIGSCEDYTDNYGIFKLRSCEPGCYRAVVSHYDYEPTTVLVEIHAGHNTISTIALDPVQ